MLDCWHHHVCLFTVERWRGRMKEGGDQEQTWKVARNMGKVSVTLEGKEKETACVHKSWISKFNLLYLISLFSLQSLHWIIKQPEYALIGCLLLVFGWAFNYLQLISVCYSLKSSKSGLELVCLFVLWIPVNPSSLGAEKIAHGSFHYWCLAKVIKQLTGGYKILNQ